MLFRSLPSTQFEVRGSENQNLIVILNPGCALYVNTLGIVYFNDWLTPYPVNQSYCGTPTEHTPTRCKFINNTHKPGYISLNKNGGKILTLKTDIMKKLLIREDVILAHTPAAALKKAK